MLREDILLEIHGKNELNRLCLEELDYVLPQLQKYVGKKILNVDNKPSKSFDITFLNSEPKKQEGRGYAIRYPSWFDYRSVLWLQVKLSFPSSQKHSCQYFELNMYVGKFDRNGLVLESVEPIEEIIKNYNLDKELEYNQVITNLRMYQELDKRMAGIKRSLIPLDESFLHSNLDIL